MRRTEPAPSARGGALHITVQIRQGSGMVRVAPGVTASAPAVAEVLHATLWTGTHTVVLDLRDVPCVTAPLAVAISRAGRRIRRNGGELTVVRPPTPADRRDLLDLTEACTVVDNLESAGWRERSPTREGERRHDEYADPAVSDTAR